MSTDRHDTITQCTSCGMFVLSDSRLPVDSIGQLAHEIRLALARNPHMTIGQVIVNALGISCPPLSIASNDKLIEEVRSL